MTDNASTDTPYTLNEFIIRWRAFGVGERVALAAFARPVTADEVATAFEWKVTAERRRQVTNLLKTLTALGQAHSTADGRWMGE